MKGEGAYYKTHLIDQCMEYKCYTFMITIIRVIVNLFQTLPVPYCVHVNSCPYWYSKNVKIHSVFYCFGCEGKKWQGKRGGGGLINFILQKGEMGLNR